MQTMRVVEGGTEVLVPVPDETSQFPPSTAAVFYNPEMRVNRDITVSCAAMTGGTYLDALAASGIRGIRVAREAGLSVVLNDWDEAAHGLILQNVELNAVACEVTLRNANVTMLDRHFDIIDLDPFGSPVHFLDAACNSAQKMLCVTATDLAPLCGAHRKAGIRKYAAVPLNTEYHAEMAVRILMGTVARTLARYDRGMEPLLSFAHMHYVRLFAGVRKGIKQADASMEELGCIFHCFGCGHRQPVKGLNACASTDCRVECPYCGKRMKAAGPLWLGALHSVDFCSRLAEDLDRRGFGEAAKLAGMCRDELPVPTFYDYHRICGSLGISAVPLAPLMEALERSGFRSSRTHFSGVGIKTDAGIQDIRKACVSI